MNYEEIEKFLHKSEPWDSPVQISFRDRRPVKGIFIRTADYDELRRKNLWRIVSEMNMSSFSETRDLNLARIFNGSAFTRLERVSK
jgi:hypothetical protein